MQLAVITALGVGGSTLVGALIGFLLKKIPHKFNDGMIGLAAGIMLSAAFFGLVAPSLETGNLWVTSLGIVAGAAFLDLADKLTPHLHTFANPQPKEESQRPYSCGIQGGSLDKILLFVMAIAIHNLPEGIAAGVGFGSEDLGNAVTVAVGIGLQNIPEGMVIVAPLLREGVSGKKVLAIAAGTGLIEILGTMAGYFAAAASAVILPFALAFAGGTMIYVVSDEMIPETHSHGYERMATYALLAGFLMMMALDHVLQ